MARQSLVPISDLASNPLRMERRTKQVDDGAGGLLNRTVTFPVWFEPFASGKTPMCKAFDVAGASSATSSCLPACHPPLIVNITDGQPTDGDPEPRAAMIRELGSQDGNVLLFNAHISSRDERPIEFPSREEELPDDAARLLFRMSSKLPPPMLEKVRREGMHVNGESCGFVFNADLVSVIRFLAIGTGVDTKNLR